MFTCFYDKVMTFVYVKMCRLIELISAESYLSMCPYLQHHWDLI